MTNKNRPAIGYAALGKEDQEFVDQAVSKFASNRDLAFLPFGTEHQAYARYHLSQPGNLAILRQGGPERDALLTDSTLTEVPNLPVLDRIEILKQERNRAGHSAAVPVMF